MEENLMNLLEQLAKDPETGFGPNYFKHSDREVIVGHYLEEFGTIVITHLANRLEQESGIQGNS